VNQPLYKQVTDTVIQRIVDAQYPPGSILPSEFELAAEMNVSHDVLFFPGLMSVLP